MKRISSDGYKWLMIVSSDGIRVQHLVEISGLFLVGGVSVITSTTSSDLSVKLVIVSSGLVLLLISLL